MLLLAHITSRHPDWSEAEIRLLRELLDKVRVNAEPVVLVAPAGKDIDATIREQDGNTD